MQKEFTIKGTHCHSCKVLLEDVLEEISGVHLAEVDFSTGKTKLEYDESLDWEKVREEIKKVGDYELEGV